VLGRTGHTEAVLVVYDPEASRTRAAARLLGAHDPTQGMRQGNDVGTQYRSAIYWYDDEQRAPPRRRAIATRRARGRGYDAITTEIARRAEFYYAEATTSSTSRRTRAATAGSAARA
jgi:peptide-methionine (S)-S-oxide reductase